MKRILLTLVALTVLALSSGTSYAWRIFGNVVCASTGEPIPSAVVVVDGTNCNGSFYETVGMIPGGFYSAGVDNCVGTYNVCLDTTTLPPGDTLVGSPCVTTSVGTTSSNQDVEINFTVNCGVVWHVSGTVVCASTGAPIPNAIVNVAGTSCSGPFSISVTTDSTGSYLAAVPACNGTYTYTVCIDATTLPPGDDLVGSACTSVTLTPANTSATVDYTVNCGPPPCPPCVDPSLGLGAASSTTVLELGASQVSINGPAGGIIGNVYIAPGGKANFSGGGEFLTGNVFLGAGATYQNSGLIVGGSVLTGQNLTAQIDAAYTAATTAAALPCTQNFTTLDGKSVTTITGHSGLNVICVQNINIQGNQIKLTGPSDAKFIFNITGQFVLNGGGAGPQIRVDTSAGLTPSDVLYNVIGNGQDIQFNGGGGGANCCAAIVDGTLLAPYRKIALSPGLVNGEVISSEDISIVSGSSVRCPVCQ